MFPDLFFFFFQSDLGCEKVRRDKGNLAAELQLKMEMKLAK